MERVTSGTRIQAMRIRNQTTRTASASLTIAMLNGEVIRFWKALSLESIGEIARTMVNRQAIPGWCDGFNRRVVRPET